MQNLEESSLANKSAIVHEWFSPSSKGGAEKVVREIDNCLRDISSCVDLFALVDGESQTTNSWLTNRNIKTSFLQKFPFGIKNIQSYLPLLPLAIEQLDLSQYELIISSSHLVAKGVITSPDQLHISYIHTPARYAWDQMHNYLERSRLNKIGLGPLIRWQLHKLRLWDQLSGARVDHLIANSRFTSRRIKKYWGRSSEIIHPPVEVDRFKYNQPREDFYLCLSRLVPNKRVDIVVKAFNKLQLPLLVVGDGPEHSLIKKISGPTVQVLGYKSKLEVSHLMSRCKAFVYAGIEDFGIAPVEAMAAGAPVIALAKGGLLDSVRCFTRVPKNPTGLLFKKQSVGDLIEALKWFEESKLSQKFSSESIRLWAERFRPEVFALRFEKSLKKSLSLHKKNLSNSSRPLNEILGRDANIEM